MQARCASFDGALRVVGGAERGGGEEGAGALQPTPRVVAGVGVLRARYNIPLDHVYAHNWIDFKDARYCEGCALATLARQWGE